MSEQARLVAADAERPIREAATFVAVTFLIAAAVYLPLLGTDLGWIDGPLPPGLPVVGILSPGLATLLLRGYGEGLDGVRSVLGELTTWRFGRDWWGVTLALPPAFAAVFAGAVIALGQDFTPDPMGVVAEFGVALLPLVLLTLVLSFGEEVGWRGQLLPLLQARLNALNASLVVGVVWAIWHLPVFYGVGMEPPVIAVRLLSLPAGAVMYTWLFNNTGGSVLAVTVLHAGTNLWGRLLATAPTAEPAASAFTAVNALLAVGLLVIYGRRTLTDRRSLAGR